MMHLVERLLLTRKCVGRIQLFCRWSSNLPAAIKLSNVRMRPDVESDRSPILVFHGLFGNKNNWRTLSNTIANQTGRIVYSIDLRNHGDNEVSPEVDTTYLGMASDILRFMEDRSFSKAVLIGHSLGGRVTMKFASLFPQMVEKMVCVDITPFPMAVKDQRRGYSMSDIVHAMMSSLGRVTDDMTITAARQYVDDLLSKSVEDKFIRDFLLLSFYKCSKTGQFKWKYNLSALLHGIQNDLFKPMDLPPCPSVTLFIHGGESAHLKPYEYDKIRDIFPLAQMFCIDGADHYLHITHKDDFLRETVNFINSD